MGTAGAWCGNGILVVVGVALLNGVERKRLDVLAASSRGKPAGRHGKPVGWVERV